MKPEEALAIAKGYVRSTMEGAGAIKGDPGKDGITPHIGDNDNWWIGDTDTGVKAKGEDGKDGTDGSGGSSLDVYSTEETVVGTWIDGKPIYRMTVLISTGNVTNPNQYIDVSMDMTQLNFEKVINIYGYLDLTYAHVPIPTPGITHYYCMLLYAVPHLVLRTNNPNWANSPCYITLEYTKTTDTATIEIPSVTALAEAYEEGVNEA